MVFEPDGGFPQSTSERSDFNLRRIREGNSNNALIIGPLEYFLLDRR